MTPVIHSAPLPNQVTLPYVEQGAPAGVPVLLLHGITDSWRSFEGVLPHLPTSLHAFALSQRGHGDAARPMTGYYPQDFAADLAAFMDTLKLGPAVVVGHSMGSYIAQRFALDYPDRTLGLVLMGSFTTTRGNPVVVDLWDSAVSTLTDPIDPGFVREFQRSTLARPVPQALLDTVVQESLKVPARVWQATLAALLDTDFSGELGKITTPTLIVWDSAVSTLTDPIDPGFVREFQQSTLAQPVPQALLDTVVQESLKVPARVWKAALAALLDTDFSGELGKITAPTLIVWGDQDAFFLRREQEALTAAITGAQLMVYPGAGHGFHWEEPARFAADLAAFTERIQVSQRLAYV